ncbi:putative polysaccharide biosynthesis protein [Stanieria sp. NIES-3757]|nr:putative polysaccharide biosynthesis protein [Stanieria sp. NIES-3757]
MRKKLLIFSKKLSSPNFRKIISNISWLVIERVLRMVVGFVVLAWIARYLGTAQFGLLNYGIAFIDLFGNLADLGLNQILIRDLVSEPERKDEILGTAFVLKSLAGVGTFLLSLISIFVLRPEDQLSQILVLILALRLVFQPIDIVDQLFQSQVQAKYGVWARNTSFLIISVVRVVLLETGGSLIAFAWTFLIESLISNIFMAIAYQKTTGKIINWRGKFLRAKQMLRVSWPLILSSLAIVVYLRIDQIMLGQLASDQEVGVYSAAVKLSEAWPILILAIVKSFSPAIISAKQVSQELYYQKIQRLANLLTLIVYAIAIPMTFLATPLVILVFGTDYAAAGAVLSIHIWASVFGFLGYIKEVWIATEELTKFALAASVSGAILNILLNWWLIPIYGAVGAAIATVLSYGFADYVMCFLYPPARPMGLVMTKAMTLNGLFKNR